VNVAFGHTFEAAYFLRGATARFAFMVSGLAEALTAIDFRSWRRGVGGFINSLV
jgi:hypothetical protein